jgi:hypothetical protein
MNIHSGKKLSEVPYEDIKVGMELISAIGNPGKVVEKISKEEKPNRDDDNWIVIHWLPDATLQPSIQPHFLLDKITVK